MAAKSRSQESSTSKTCSDSVTVETRGGPVIVSEPGPREVLPLVAVGVEIVKNGKGLLAQVKATLENEADMTELGFAFIAELNANPDQHIDHIGTMLALFTDKDADWLLDKKNMALSDLLALLEGAARVVPFERYMELSNLIMKRFGTLGSTSTPSSDSDADTPEPTLTDSDSTKPSGSASE